MYEYDGFLFLFTEAIQKLRLARSTEEVGNMAGRYRQLGPCKLSQAQQVRKQNPGAGRQVAPPPKDEDPRVSGGMDSGNRVWAWNTWVHNSLVQPHPKTAALGPHPQGDQAVQRWGWTLLSVMSGLLFSKSFNRGLAVHTWSTSPSSFGAPWQRLWEAPQYHKYPGTQGAVCFCPFSRTSVIPLNLSLCSLWTCACEFC